MSRFRLVASLLSFLVSVFQFYVIWHGAVYFFEVDGILGKILVTPLAFILGWLPPVNTVLSILTVTNVWGWSLTKAFVVFFSFVPFAMLSFVLEKQRRARQRMNEPSGVIIDQ